jgi:hypothetical protein
MAVSQASPIVERTEALRYEPHRLAAVPKQLVKQFEIALDDPEKQPETWMLACRASVP